jgi:hypothetical protein
MRETFFAPLVFVFPRSYPSALNDFQLVAGNVVRKRVRQRRREVCRRPAGVARATVYWPSHGEVFLLRFGVRLKSMTRAPIGRDVVSFRRPVVFGLQRQWGILSRVATFRARWVVLALSSPEAAQRLTWWNAYGPSSGNPSLVLAVFPFYECFIFIVLPLCVFFAIFAYKLRYSEKKRKNAMFTSHRAHLPCSAHFHGLLARPEAAQRLTWWNAFAIFAYT